MKKNLLGKVTALSLTIAMAVSGLAGCGSSSAATSAAASSAAASTAASSAAASMADSSAAASTADSVATSSKASGTSSASSTTASVDTSTNNLKGKKIDVLLKSYTHMFWVEAANEAKALGEEYGCDVEILAPTVANSNEEQIQLIESALVSPPDLFIIVPADSEGIAPAIQEINDAGIPIVNVNTKIADTSVSYNSFVSCNQYDLGNTTISTAIDSIGETGKAVIIFGKPGAQTYVDRETGAKDAFAKHSGWEVLDDQVANGDRNQAMTVMQNLLTKYSDITMVYAEDGEMALGAAEALKQAGKTDIKIVCENSNTEICQAIEDGSIFMTYDDAAWAQTKLGFEVANMVLGGEKVEDTYYSEIQLVNSSNVKEYAKRYSDTSSTSSTS